MATNCPNKLSVVSCNIHGLNQGAPGFKHMIDLFTPYICLIQEHWLTTDNLTKLHCLSDDYFTYGSSAIYISISSGPLHGRPYEGTAAIVHKKHAEYSKKCSASGSSIDYIDLDRLRDIR